MATLKLNTKQKRFVEEYLVDLNTTKAAKRAGYSEKSAYSIGHDLLKKPEIVTALQKAKEKRAEKVGIEAEEVIEELRHIAFSRLNEAIEWEFDPQTGRRQFKAPHSKKLGKGISAAISEVSFSRNGIKVKLHDKLSALDKLSRHLGLYEKDNTQEINLNAGTEALERMLSLMGEHKEKMEDEQVGQ